MSWTSVISSCRTLKRWKAAFIEKKPKTLGWDYGGSGNICLYCCLRKLGSPRVSANYCLSREFVIIIQCSPCILMGCVFVTEKCHYQELEHSQRENNHGTDTWVVEYGWLFAGRKHSPFQMFFPPTPNLSTETKDNRLCNTMSSVTCSRGKVKFRSSVSGPPTSSG